MRRLARSLIAAALLCAAATSGPTANAQGISETKKTVARLYGNIAALTAYLGVCGASDADKADSFAEALQSYRQEVAPVLKRLDTVLRGELKREGGSGNSATRMYAAADDAAVRRIEDLQEKHPDQFGVLCDGILKIARERRFEFAPLRERFPDEMRKLDEWE